MRSSLHCQVRVMSVLDLGFVESFSLSAAFVGLGVDLVFRISVVLGTF